MDGDPAGRAAEQGDGSGAGEALPTPGTRSESPAGPGDRAVPVSVVTSPASEGAPPPYSPPDPKSFHVLYPPYPGGFSQQGPVFYQPGPGPRPFPAMGFPAGSLPYPAVRTQPRCAPARLCSLISPPGSGGSVRCPQRCLSSPAREGSAPRGSQL